jgi:hypothetical protein
MPFRGGYPASRFDRGRSRLQVPWGKSKHYSAFSKLAINALDNAEFQSLGKPLAAEAIE